MKLIANHVNNSYLEEIVRNIGATTTCTGIDAAVAYVTKCDSLFDLCRQKSIPFQLWCLCNPQTWPSIDVFQKFLDGPQNWRLYLTKNYFHAKVIWFRGVGAYIGSANLTDNGWFSNIEAGIFLEDEDLVHHEFDIELEQLFDQLMQRSREATNEDFIEIQRLTKEYEADQKQSEQEIIKAFEKTLLSIPGSSSPYRKEQPRDKAKNRFVQEWANTLQLLRNLQSELNKRVSPPSWLPANTIAAVEIDQMLNWYYEHEIYGTELGVREETRRSHIKNKTNPLAKFQQLLDRWNQQTQVDSFIREILNEWAPELQQRLQPDAIKSLCQDGLYEIFRRSHAIRMHARQMRKETLGVPEDSAHDMEQCSKLFASWLWSQRSPNGGNITDLLLYVIWHKRKPVAERLWEATRAKASKWVLPHFGLSSLGELIGWARPDEFPPRNNRVSRALFALGFEVQCYGDDYNL